MTIINIGVRPFQSRKIRSKIRLSNIFALISFFIFTASGLNNINLGDLFSGYFLEILGSLCLITWLINYFGKPKLSITYLFGLISIAIFYFDSYSGINSGTYLYYFPLLLAIANIFDFNTRPDRIRMISHLIFIGLLVFVNLFTDHSIFENETMTESQKKTMFIFNMAFSISCLSYFIFLIVNSNIQKVTLLKNLIAEESKLRALEEEKNRDKEILLAELQHRLKNNLSLMSSLLKLKLENINDANYSLAFKESIHAIQTVAQANHLQKFDDGKLLVPMNIYLNEINLYWSQLLENSPIQGKVSLKCSDYLLNVKQAIPIGLIFHEVISLFWFYCLENEIDCTLDFKVSENNNQTKVLIHSSVPVLFQHNRTKEVIIQALIEQIDAQGSQISQNDYVIEISSGVHPMLESETLFRKK